MTEQVFSKWAFEHSPHHHCSTGGVGCLCVCVRELGLCVPFSPQAEPFASRGRRRNGRRRGHVTVCIHVWCVHVCMHAACGCITCVGVKKCYIFTSCCLSLLIDAQQQCRMALAWPLSTARLKRRALTYLGVGEMFPSPHFFAPLTPFCNPPQPDTFDMPNFTLSFLSSSPLPCVSLAGF